MVQKEMKIEAQPCHTLEICIHPPNVLHEYQCKIENFGFIQIPDICFVFVFVFVYPYFNSPPRMFCKNMGRNTLLIFQIFSEIPLFHV